MNTTAVAERIETPLALSEEMQPSTQLTPIQMAYQLIARGADFASVKEMIALGKELEADAAKKVFNIAMAEAQSEMEPVRTNANNSQTKSKYATYDQLDRAIRPIYTKHGFGLSFDEADSPKLDHIRVVCEVTHKGGFSKSYHRDMPADGKGAKGGDVMTKTHAAGAAASYGMRYILRGIFNIAVGEGDRDGNAVPASSKTISEAQVKELTDLIAKAGSTVVEFCEVGNIEDVAELLIADLADAKFWLNERIKTLARATPKVDPKTQFDQMERAK